MTLTHKKKLFQTRISFLITLFSFCFALGIFIFPQLGLAVQATLAWDVNTEEDLAGYRLFNHSEGETYNYDTPDWQGTDTTCTFSGLTENATYYFVARAYDTSNNESADSQEISYITYTILLSLSSDRSDPALLQDETVSENIFAFVGPTSGINQVSFFLDDPEMSGDPYKVEDLVNYDFAGTAGDGAAFPFDTTTLSNGAHQITGLIELSSGNTRVVNAAFTVTNTANTAPTADAGPDQTVNAGDTVTLDGSNSSDPDGTIQTYSWNQTSGSSVTLSDSSAIGPTFTAPSGAQTLVFELTVTDNGGLTDTDTVSINIPASSVNLTSLSISGSSSVDENTTSNYVATATFSDNSTQTVTGSTSWSENSSYASISSSGVLSTSAVPSNQAVTISASYTYGGVTETDQMTVTIVDVPPTLSSLSIDGSSSVNEDTTSNYTATATFSDNSTQAVTGSASWSENSVYSSINSSGVLTTSEVTNDEAVTITAGFTSGAVTRTAQQVVTIVDVPEENLPPVAPVVSSPYDGQMECGLMPTITTEAFSDPNDDLHGRSEWQISTQQDFSSATVLDVNTDEHLTDLAVPHTVLEPETTYYLRVRFYDIFLEPSDWSATIGFTTAVDNNDTDENGIPDDQDVGYGVDIDENGTDDVDEPERIKTVQSVDDTITIGVAIESPNVTSIDAAEVIDPSTISDTTNRPDNLTHVLSYRISVSEVGATAQVTIYFSYAISSWMSFYKYDTINGWQDYSAHTTYNGDGRSITVELLDGGYGDSDGEANGVIVDPGGLGGSVESVGSAVVSGPTGGGCFIAGAGYNLNAKPSTNKSRTLLLPVGLILVAYISRIWKKRKHSLH